MRPILLYGHSRPLTCVKYNREGDLLFTASKDHFPHVWYADSGERLGVYVGHAGSVWHLDVDFHSERMLTGGADNTMRLWDVQSGRNLFTFSHRAPIRCVEFNTGDSLALAVGDNLMGQTATVMLYRITKNAADQKPFEDPIANFGAGRGEDTMHRGKITAAHWTSLNKHIVTAGDDGFLRKWDSETGKLVGETKGHNSAIRNFNFSDDRSFIITSSADASAKLFDAVTLEHLKTYKTDRPVNSAVVSPLRNHIILGGGQEAIDVTTTSSRQGKFECRIYDLVHEDYIGMVKGHFGPVNALAFSPSGDAFVSGGEDGTVRVNKFDQSYYNLSG
eukprot:c20597_g1_i1.p1 GENE.c20597_g1_i1~~c20597_g1_i1.p1  ORF type:complete len:354 (+),score=58.75 c20597_g1_i1:66-1064(+)